MTRKKRRRKDDHHPGGGGRLQPDDIAKMRAAGHLAAELLDMIAREIRAGMSTQDIDQLVDEMTRARGAISAPYRYHGFPGHCCTSINDVVCHGIPSAKEVLREGDIVNVDVTPKLDGYHGDTSITYLVGSKASALARKSVSARVLLVWRKLTAPKPAIAATTTPMMTTTMSAITNTAPRSA